ncbi:MAG: cobalamin-dependent protein [Acidobacteriota bacterium]
MSNQRPSLPTLRADLLLLHPPAVFDFRERRDIYFPFLGTSGDVPITPLYEYFPLGFKTLQRYLAGHGHEVRIINLSTLLLRFPNIELETLAQSLEVKLVGVDFHWMVHVQGSLAVAREMKRLLEGVPILLGGISSTYYAERLIQYSFVDMVMRGYDTHGSMALLLDRIKQGGDLATVPNLLWKSKEGEIHDNGSSLPPDHFGCGIDWSIQPRQTGDAEGLPILELISSHNAGCSHNCGWCGGSRQAFGRVFGSGRTLVRKRLSEIAYEFETIKRLPGANLYHLYSVGTYNESRKRLELLIDRVQESDLRSISYEQFFLTPDDLLRRMARANPRTTITLSPQSHDLEISRLSGRGTYTNRQLERWLDKAFNYGISAVDLWYFIGMPRQDARSVKETVDYCAHLLDRFKGCRVRPLLCPMIPFLDPASTFFEDPGRYGYRLFHRTLEEHRRGMCRASIINRINYETRWLSRSDLIFVGFQAVRDLMRSKAEARILPETIVQGYNSRIEDALQFIRLVHEVDCLADAKERERALDGIGDEILLRNNKVLFSGVANQAFPVDRPIGGRWFDETGWEPGLLEAAAGTPAAD